MDLLGPPLSSERVTTTNDFDTIDRDTYPGGMVLEYDEYKKSGRVMLGLSDPHQAKKISALPASFTQAAFSSTARMFLAGLGSSWRSSPAPGAPPC